MAELHKFYRSKCLICFSATAAYVFIRMITVLDCKPSSIVNRTKWR